MIKKVIYHPVSLLITITIASKLIGFFREVLLAYFYGAGAEYDLFLISFTIPVIIVSISTYAFPNFIIPRLGGDGNQKGTFLVFYYMLSVLVSVVLVVCARWLVLLVDPTLNSENLRTAVNLIRILSVYTLFFNLFNIYKSFYHSDKKYILPALSQLFVHITLIAVISLFHAGAGVYAIVFGLALGSAFQLLLPMLRYHIGQRGRFSIFFSGKLGEFTASIMIIFLIEIFGQLHGFFDRYFAAKLETGIISAINYGTVLYMLPTSVFILSVGAFIFPYFRDHFTARNFKRLDRITGRSFLAALGLGLMILVIYRLFSDFIIRIIYERGAFDAAATQNTAGILSVYAFGIPFVMLHFITARLLLVLKKEGFLLAGNLIGLSLKVLFLFHRGDALSFIDIPLSTVIANTSSFLWSGAWYIVFYYRIKRNPGRTR